MTIVYPFEDAPIRLSARGEWFHGDDPMHPRVAALFGRSIDLDASERYIIRLGHQTAPFEVEDTPYFVRAAWLDRDDDGALVAVRLKVSDGREELLDPTTLMQSDDQVLYCRVLRGAHALPCRFFPAQYHDLALAMEETTDPGRFALRLDGRLHPLHPYDARPLRV